MTTNSSATDLTESPSEGRAVLSGDVTDVGGITEVFNRVGALSDVQRGILTVLSDQTNGRVGISCGRYVTGALLLGTKETGTTALKTIMSMQSGAFSFSRADESGMADLQQSLGLDIFADLAAIGEPSLLVESGGDSPFFLSDANGEFEALYRYEAKLAPKTHKAPPGPIEQMQDFIFQGGIDLSKSKLGLVLAALTSNPRKRQGSEKPLSQHANNRGKNTDTKSDQQCAGANLVFSESTSSFTDSPANQASISGFQQPQPGAPIISEATDSDRPSVNAAVEAPSPRMPQAQGKYGYEASHLRNSIVAGQKPDSKRFVAQIDRDEDGRTYLQAKFLRAVDLTLFGVVILSVAIFAGFIIERTASSSWSNQHSSKGLRALRAGNYKEAISAFTLDSGNSSALFGRGLAFLASARYEQALADFDQAEAAGNKMAVLSYARARAYLAMGKNSNAIEAASKAIDEDSNLSGAFLVRATAYAADGKLKDSISDCTKMLTHKVPKELETQFVALRASDLFQQKEYEAAKLDYESAIKSDPKESKFYFGQGLCLLRLNLNKSALESFNKALVLTPENFEISYQRGLCCKAIGQYKEAVADFSQCIKHLTYLANAYRERGFCYLQLENWSAAVNDYDSALALVPVLTKVTEERQIAYDHLRSGKKRETVAMDLPGQELTASPLPEDPLALTKMGYLYLQSGATDLAITCLTKAVRKSPNTAQPRRYLAHACMSNKQFDAAAEQFRAISMIGGSIDSDTLGLAQALLETKHFNQAIKVLEAFLRDKPNEPQAVRLLSIASERKGAGAAAAAAAAK